MIYFLLFTLSLLPLRVLYVLSDILYFISFYILRYRRKVVEDNIRNSFPTLSRKELFAIEKQFYCDFCDNLIETVKLITISEEQLQAMMAIDYTPLKKTLEEHKNAHIYLGHQFNWEVANAHVASSLKDYNIAVVFKPIKSKLFNSIMLKLRSKFGSIMVPSNNMKAGLGKVSDKQHVLVLVADQNPKKAKLSFWSNFLSQKTAFISATEFNTARSRTPVFFVEIKKIKRGSYSVTIEPLFDFSTPHTRGTITSLFIKKLEQTIKENPSTYLWSHKRWKLKFKEEYGKMWLD